ncbi:MAG: hypothetical protein ACTHOD_13940 [Motilibacteraceae bacterium]
MPRQTVVPLAALGLAAGVVATLTGSSADVPPLTPVALDEARPVAAAADAALTFAVDTGAHADELRSVLPDRSGDSTRIELRRQDGALVSEVRLAPPGPHGNWRVLSASADGVSARSPQAGVSFDPPLSVAFRTSGDADVTVTLLAEGHAAPLATWTDQVDGGTDWYAHLNYAAQPPRTKGLVVVSSRVDGELEALEAIPVLVSSAS